MAMRSLSISKAWDETKQIAKRDGKLMTILALALIGLPTLITTFLAPEQGAGKDQSSVQSVTMLLAALVSLVGQLAIGRMAMPPATTVGAAIRHGLVRFMPLIGAVIVLTLLIIALFIPFIAIALAQGLDLENPTAASQLSGTAILVLFLTFLAIIYGAVRMMLVTPVAVSEYAGPLAILTRSWELTRGHFWRLLGFLMMVLVALIIASLAVAAVIGALVVMIFGAIEPMSAAALIAGLAQGLLSAGFTVLFVVMAMRIYVQLSGRESVDTVD